MLALDLIRDGATLLAKPDRHLTAQARNDLMDRRSAAFERLDKNLWGEAYPNGRRHALDQPEEFVAQSHDAVSLALGLAGVHVAVLNRQLADHPAAPGQAMDMADARYSLARELLDKSFLPLTRHRLVRSAALESTGQWKGHAGIVRSRLVGPGALNSIGLLGDAAGISVLLKRAIVWAWPGVTTQDIDMAARDVLHQVQGFVMPLTTGTQLTLKLRRAPGTAGLNLQTARLIAATRSGGPDVSGVLSLPGLVNLKIGAYAADNTLEHALEVMGTDLGIHLLQFGKLRPVVDAMMEAPDDAQALRRSFEVDPGLIACYFANPAVVPTLIDRFLACSGDAAWTAQPGKPHPNEFYRYFRTEPFQRLAEAMGDARRHGPGMATQHREGGSPPVLESSWMTDPPDLARWNAMKARIAALGNPEQRFGFYVDTPDGREAFRMFCAILDTTCRINEAAGHQVFRGRERAHPFGFGTKLREAALKTGRVEPRLPEWDLPPPTAGIPRAADLPPQA